MHAVVLATKGNFLIQWQVGICSEEGAVTGYLAQISFIQILRFAEKSEWDIALPIVQVGYLSRLVNSKTCSILDILSAVYRKKQDGYFRGYYLLR